MSLKKHTTNGKLDAVLRFLNYEYSKTFVKEMPLGISTEKQYLKTKMEILSATSFGISSEWIDEIDLILEYLLDVEHLIIKEGDKYRILYKGKVFIEDGGYAHRHEVENSAIIMAKIISGSTVAGVLMAGIGSILFLLWDICKFHHTCICH